VVREATGMPSLADDSGIEVLGLGDWPGVESARWMGEAATDRDRLLGLLARVAAETPGDRRARYMAALALALPSGEHVGTTGACYGVLVDPPRGARGFGYDPAFLSDDLGITFGEADDALKDTVSHRAKALRLLLDTGVLDAL
jgi:XTP/dITP diphosphohydrolase